MKKIDYPELIEQLALRNVDIMHLQNGVSEAFRGILSSFSDNKLSNGVKLTGCIVTLDGSEYSCTEGYIYLSGEVFRVPAHSLMLPIGHGAYFSIEESDYDSARPSPIRSGGTYQTRKERIVKMVSSSELPLSKMELNSVTLKQLIWETSHSYGEIYLFDPRLMGKEMEDFFDMTTGIGLPEGDKKGYIVLGIYSGTESYKGKVIVSIDKLDSDLDAVGKVYGEKEHKLTIAEMPEHDFDYNGRTGSGLGSLGSGSSDFLATNLKTNKLGSDEPHNNMQPSIVAAYITRLHPDLSLG